MDPAEPGSARHPIDDVKGGKTLVFKTVKTPAVPDHSGDVDDHPGHGGLQHAAHRR